MFLTDEFTFLTMYQDYTVSTFEVPQTLLKETQSMLLKQLESRTVLRNVPTTFLQMQRAVEKKNLFFAYDVTNHFIYWFMIEKAKLVAAESAQSKNPPTDGLEPIKDFFEVSDLKVKKKMILKRFDFFKFVGRNVAMQSEYWDCWYFVFE